MTQPPEGLSEEYLIPRDAYRQIAAERDALLEQNRILLSIRERAFTHAERLEIQVADDSGFALSLIDQNVKLTAERDALRDVCRSLLEFEFSAVMDTQGFPAAMRQLVTIRRAARKALQRNDENLEFPGLDAPVSLGYQDGLERFCPPVDSIPLIFDEFFPYPHRTRVCAGCGTAVHEDDLADGNLCHICIKS